jgi:hypothetical protein
VTGSLVIQPFDILHEHASGLYASEYPFRFTSARVSRQTVMNNADSEAAAGDVTLLTHWGDQLFAPQSLSVFRLPTLSGHNAGRRG